MQVKCKTFPSAQFNRPFHRRIVAGAGLLSMLAFTALAQSGQQPVQGNADNPVLASVHDSAPDADVQSKVSIHIVRKADLIAKLAHGVKEEMKHAVAQR